MLLHLWSSSPLLIRPFHPFSHAKMQANLSHLSNYDAFPGVGNGIAKCPFDPEDNATAVWVENGNPGGLPGLYSGSVAEFTKADTVIFRSDLYNITTGQKIHPFKRTIKYDAKWLDSEFWLTFSCFRLRC